MLSSLAVGQAQGLPAGIGGPTAVDHQGMPVDEAALLRIGQKENRLGDIVRRVTKFHPDLGAVEQRRRADVKPAARNRSAMSRM